MSDEGESSEWELVPWYTYIRTDPRTGKGGGVAGAIVAYSHYVETGRIGALHVALLVALVRGIDWKLGASRAPFLPSVATLASWSGMSRRQATRVLADLVSEGIVDREGRIVPGRTERDTNAYRLWVPVLKTPEVE